MNPSERTKEALLAKTEALCTSIVDQRKMGDPWGGTGYLSTILRTVRMQEENDYAETTHSTPLEPAFSYATSAQKELVIKEQTAALIKTAQDISTLVRDLQELWLFGGLDTLSDPADEEANRTKALAVADMIEALARQKPVVGVKGNAVKSEETDGEGL